MCAEYYVLNGRQVQCAALSQQNTAIQPPNLLPTLPNINTIDPTQPWQNTNTQNQPWDSNNNDINQLWENTNSAIQPWQNTNEALTSNLLLSMLINSEKPDWTSLNEWYRNQNQQISK